MKKLKIECQLYIPSSVSSGEAALEFLETNNVELVILDMVLKDVMGGLDTFNKIQELYPNQKVLIVTGYSETQELNEVLDKCTPKLYLKKPYDMQKLGVIIKYRLNR